MVELLVMLTCCDRHALLWADSLINRQRPWLLWIGLQNRDLRTLR